MPPTHDTSIALLEAQTTAQQKELEAQQAELNELRKMVGELRDDKLRIEGGKWVLWVLGGVLITVMGFFATSGLAQKWLGH